MAKKPPPRGAGLTSLAEDQVQDRMLGLIAEAFRHHQAGQSISQRGRASLESEVAELFDPPPTPGTVAQDQWESRLRAVLTQVLLPYIDDALRLQAETLRGWTRDLESRVRAFEYDFRAAKNAAEVVRNHTSELLRLAQEISAVRRGHNDLAEKVAKGVRVYSPPAKGHKRRYSNDD